MQAPGWMAFQGDTSRGRGEIRNALLDQYRSRYLGFAPVLDAWRRSVGSESVWFWPVRVMRSDILAHGDDESSFGLHDLLAPAVRGRSQGPAAEGS
jgi:hypothetical protein